MSTLKDHINLQNIGVTFHPPGREVFLALNDVDLSISAGEFISLVGPSGCGKSTLLRVMAGLLRPSAGQASVGGVAVDGPQEAFSMVFQSPRLLPWLRIQDNVALPLRLGPNPHINRKEGRARALELLDLVGLVDFAGHYPHELSGGMQQRVSIARALVTDAPTLLMDEPFGALDAFTREYMNEELLRIWDETGKTIVFVTHDMDEAVFLSDRIAVMGTGPGRIVGVQDVGLPRPREAAVRSSHDFFMILSQVRDSLALGSVISENSVRL